MTKLFLKVLIAGVILVVAGAILAFVFNPSTKVRKVELNSRNTTYSLVETVGPKSMNSVAVCLNLKGKRYFRRLHRDRKFLRRDRDNHFEFLAYEVPIKVKMTRIRDGEVLVDLSHVFELRPGEKTRVPRIPSETREFTTFVGHYPEIPRQESPEDLRIELTVGKDTTYGSLLESGTLEVRQKGQAVGHTIGLSMVVLGLVCGMLSVLGLFVRLLLGMFLKQ